MTISLCMIVKNEAETLPRCLDSMQSLVEEIVIVDTGSQDSTPEIAAAYGARVYTYAWHDDFAAARNYAFSLGTQDWLMWLDADDVMEHPQAFLQFKENPPTGDVIMLPYRTAFDETGAPTFTYYRERLVRKSLPHAWKGRVHEVLTHRGRVAYAQVPVCHRSVKTAYTNRNLHIYQTQIAEGEDLSPRDMFYYGRELVYHRQYDAATAVLERFLRGEGWTENKIEACRFLCTAYEALHHTDKALAALFRSFTYAPPRAETCCELGRLFLHENQLDSAVYWHKLALTLPRQDSNGGFVQVDCYGYLPAIRLCVCYDRLGDRALAEYYNNLAGTYRPKASAYLQNAAYFAHRRNLAHTME